MPDIEDIKKILDGYLKPMADYCVDDIAQQILQLFEQQPLFRLGDFTLHSGDKSRWLIDCSVLSDEDWNTLAYMIQESITFGKVIGIPKGGLKLASALEQYKSDSNITLVVDDVFTTGKSMEEERAKHTEPTLGAVIFARSACASWIHPVFQLPAC